MVNYCLDRCKTHEMYDKAVDSFLLTLKFVPDCFVTSKMIKKLDCAIFSNYDIVFVDEDCGNTTYSNCEMGILSDDLNNIIFEDVNFDEDEDDPENIIHIRLITLFNRFKQRKACKKYISK